MLVLNRHKNDEIMIGDDVTIKVLAIYGNRVLLGIEAPDETRVLRKELTEDLAGTDAVLVRAAGEVT